ncbi:MAG: membrane protein insertase YidC [Bacteroidota bacterium]
MDRNQLIGLTLISVMLIAYAHFFSPSPALQPTQTALKQHPGLASSATSHQVDAPQLNLGKPVSKAAYGILASATQGQEKEVVLENEVIKVTLTSRGASIKEVVLKNYQDHKQQPLTLLDAQSSLMGFQFTMHGAQLNTQALFFETTAQDQSIEKTDVATATFMLPISPNQYIRQVFTLAGSGYTLTQRWEIVGLNEALGTEPIQFVWHDLVKRAEQDVKACRNKTTINYYLADKTFGHLQENSEKQQERYLSEPIRWVGVKQRFFTAGVIAQEAFSGGHIATTPTPQHVFTVKDAKVSLMLSGTDSAQDKNGQLTFYFGPNDYQTLRQVTEGFSRNISLGWPVVRWMNQFLIIPAFAFLDQHINSYGIIIILLVVFIKLLLLPLSYKSYTAMAKMRVLKPALDALKTTHGADMQKVQLEQMDLYREMGINPLSGCIPVLLQMPILLAMFNFFPNAIALRQKSFLWASDLSTYDAILHLPFSIPAYGSHVSLFTLLMTASTILYTWSNNQLTPTQGPMKVMTYVMPLTFMFVLNSFPAGLSFYYFVSNLVTFGQQSLIKWVVDEEKIKKKLASNKLKNKNKKKSRFQMHLEEAMKAAGEAKRN